MSVHSARAGGGGMAGTAGASASYSAYAVSDNNVSHNDISYYDTLRVTSALGYAAGGVTLALCHHW